MPSRQCRWLVVTGCLLVFAALVGPRIVPLYDGVGFPDEPYRYVGRTTDNPPTVADRFVKVNSLKDFNQFVTSTETGPQVAITLDVNSIKLSSGADGVEVKAAPLAPASQPPGGKIAGNVYEVTITSDPGPPILTKANILVALRFPTEIPRKNPPVMVYRTGTAKWQSLKTSKIGADIYQAGFQGPGQYALVSVAKSGTATFASTWPWVWVGVVALLVGASVLFIRSGGYRGQSHEQIDR